jgi:rubrerythrin
MSDLSPLLQMLQQAWRREMEGAVTYRALAEREEEENRKRLLLRLAETEEKHAARWAQRLEELGGQVPRREKVKSPLGWSLRFARPEVIIQKMEVQEDRDIAAYERLLAEVGDAVSQQIAREALRDEREHVRTLHLLAGPVQTPAVGAFIPLIPFLFVQGMPALVASGIISIIAHFAVGVAKSLVTTRSWWASGLEMTIVGVLVGAVTYAVGALFGVG